MPRKKKTVKEQAPKQWELALIPEFKDLYEKGQKLAHFMDKDPRFKPLSNAEKYDIQRQMVAMSDYINALMCRIRRAGLYEEIRPVIEAELTERQKEQLHKDQDLNQAMNEITEKRMQEKEAQDEGKDR